MMNSLSTIAIILAPVGLVYSWVFYLTRMRKEPVRWRNRASLSSLGVVSLVCALWPLMIALLPKAGAVGNLTDYQTQIDFETRWVEAWHPPILRVLGLALVLGLIGRPRLIAPLTIACIGTAMFWIVSVLP